MFPRDRVIASLTKYNIPFSDDESSESLTKSSLNFTRTAP